MVPWIILEEESFSFNRQSFHFIINHESIIPHLQLDGVVGSQEKDGVLRHLVLQRADLKVSYGFKYENVPCARHT